jgi:hypothetical protein
VGILFHTSLGSFIAATSPDFPDTNITEPGSRSALAANPHEAQNEPRQLHGREFKML